LARAAQSVKAHKYKRNSPEMFREISLPSVKDERKEYTIKRKCNIEGDTMPDVIRNVVYTV